MLLTNHTAENSKMIRMDRINMLYRLFGYGLVGRDGSQRRAICGEFDLARNVSSHED